MKSRQQTTRTGARRALTVLAGAALALGLGTAASPAAHAAPDDPDLAVSISGSVTANIGQTPTLIVSVVNNRDIPSDPWSLTTTYPSDLAPGATPRVTGGSADCAVAVRTITCTGGSLTRVPAPEVLRIIVEPEVLTYSAPAVEWTAEISTTNDAVASNNTATGTLRITDPGDDDPAGAGDWGTSGSDLMAPGTGTYYDVAFTCLSAGGCDYGPGITITDRAHAAAAFGPGPNHLYLNDQTSVGDCQVTEEAIDCAVTATGHADQGDVLSSRAISYGVSADAPADTQMFAQTIAFPADWTGNDPSNDVYPISTPPEVGAPIVSWQAGAGLGGLVLLLGGGALLWRRNPSTEPVAA